MSSIVPGTMYVEGLPKRIHKTIAIYRHITRRIVSEEVSKDRRDPKRIISRIILEFADTSSLALASEMGGVYLSSAPLINSSIIYISVLSKILEASQEGVESMPRIIDSVSKLIEDMLIGVVRESYIESVRRILEKEKTEGPIYLFGSDFFAEAFTSQSRGDRVTVVIGSPWDTVLLKRVSDWKARTVNYVNLSLDMLQSGGRGVVIVEAETLLSDKALALSGSFGVVAYAKEAGARRLVLASPLSTAVWLPSFIKYVGDVAEIIPSYHIIQEWGESVSLKILDPVNYAMVDGIVLGDRIIRSSDVDYVTLTMASSDMIRRSINDMVDSVLSSPSGNR